MSGMLVPALRTAAALAGGAASTLEEARLLPDFIEYNFHQELNLIAKNYQAFGVIALIILLLFGGAKLPALMRGLGKGVKEFKDEVAGNGTKPEDADSKPQADNKDLK